MQVKVLFFALYRERAGQRELILDLPTDATVAEGVARVREMFPQLAPAEMSMVTAVNAEYAEASQRLSQGDELALIPPVSGGASD